eukprot:scaffold285663_cov16-Prasinocladus_malaysianus.AAC.2
MSRGIDTGKVQCLATEALRPALPNDVIENIAKLLPSYMSVSARSVSNTWKAEVDRLYNKDGAAFKEGKDISMSKRDNLCRA